MKFTKPQLTSSALTLCAGALLLGSIGPAQAVDRYRNPPGKNYDETYELQEVTLQGTNTRRSEWYRMDTVNYISMHHGSGYPGSRWNNPLPPNVTFGPDNTARLYKGTVEEPRSGANGHLSSMGIYTAMSKAPFMVMESTPVADLHTVVFQIYLTTGSDPMPGSWEEAYGVDGDLSKLPVLRLLNADNQWSDPYLPVIPEGTLYQSSEVPFGHGPVDEMEGEPSLMMFLNYRSYNWDLSAVPYDVVSFAVEFELHAHVNLRSISLDQAGGLIPEPTHIAALLSLILLSGTLLRRRPQ